MEFTNNAIFAGAILFLISILATGVASRAGAPLLLVFLGVGMLAGREGIGGITFESFEVAYAVGSVALAIILFDGGMRARAESSKIGLKPALSLATLGVLLTTAVVAVGLHWLFNFSWSQSFLIGAIVGSTDAAAVFSMLHAKGLQLKKRVGTTLEIESGCNDPMAVFLTLMFVEGARQGQDLVGSSIILEFVYQFGIGAILGWIGGQVLSRTISRVTLTAGLYPLLAAAGGLTLFGLVTTMGASGFLAIYIAGLIVGNTEAHAANNIRKVHDGLAWLAQISLFLMLGLLVTPTTLTQYWGVGVVVALLLVFVARPIAVLVSLSPFRFAAKEKLFISWVGLRGAVPIVLATFPVLGGLPDAELYFNVAFVSVLFSLVIQGWTVVPFAKWLKLKLPIENAPYYAESIEVPGSSDLTIVGYKIAEDSPVTKRRIDSLLAPDGIRFIAVFRGDEPVQGMDEHVIESGDLLYVISPQKKVSLVNQMLLPTDEVAELEQARYFGDFTLNGDAIIDAVADMYGGEVPSSAKDMTLSQFMQIRFRNQCVVGDRVFFGPLELVVKEVDDLNVVQKVGLRIRE
ncbi:MAG: potassium/proton antiporter [Proteobacteria bacterium]|nr:potassium/proton antiporter [Pseudomonadota bacterium]MDA1011987.1 potassium/proton antiporter [Pseudomonadota bacterium]